MDIQFMFFATLVKAYEGSIGAFEAWYRDHVRFADHHMCHESTAIHTSGFETCAFVSQDGGGDMGDPGDIIFGEYCDGKMHVVGQHQGLHNICSYHAFVTDACGFGGGEIGKTSGLAAYGNSQPKLVEYLRALNREDGGGRRPMPESTRRRVSSLRGLTDSRRSLGLCRMTVLAHPNAS